MSELRAKGEGWKLMLEELKNLYHLTKLVEKEVNRLAQRREGCGFTIATLLRDSKKQLEVLNSARGKH